MFVSHLAPFPDCQSHAVSLQAEWQGRTPVHPVPLRHYISFTLQPLAMHAQPPND